MEYVLIYYDLFGFVDDTIPCPPRYVLDFTGVESLNPSYSACIKSDQCVRTWFTSTLTYPIPKEVHNLRTSRDLWQTLSDRYTDQCASNEMILKLQFYGYLKKLNQTISDYLSRLKSLADSLAVIKCSILEKDLTIQASDGFPSKYDAFVVGISHFPQALSFHGLCAKFLTQE